MRAKATYLLVLLALASGGVAYAALAQGHHGTAAKPAQASHAGASDVRVSGHVSGLFPGARKGLRLEVRNGSRRWAVVRAIRADVAAGATGCPPRYLSTVAKDLAYPRIRPHKTRRIGVRVRMWPAAPDACQGVKFPLRFRIRAER
jgi:hypothetical protein